MFYKVVNQFKVKSLFSSLKRKFFSFDRDGKELINFIVLIKISSKNLTP